MADTSTVRRVRKSPEQRRAEVVEAAKALALERGLEAVTLRAVAGRVGVAPGLVAHYAPSMDELVAAIFGDLVSAELRDVIALAQRADPAAERLGILLDTLLDGSRDDITLVWVQAWGMGARSEALAARVRAEMDDWHAALAAEIERGMDAGEFARGDAAGIAWHLLAMIDGLNAHSLVRWNAGPDPVARPARTLTAARSRACSASRPRRCAPGPRPAAVHNSGRWPARAGGRCPGCGFCLSCDRGGGGSVGRRTQPAAVLSRGSRWCGAMICSAARPGSSMRAVMRRTASRAMKGVSRDTVLSDGREKRPSSMSSTPITATSSGTLRPASKTARIAPIASRSE